MRLNWEGPTGSGQLDIDGEITIGRAPGNGLVLDDGQVSRRHAAIRPAADGVHVEDLGSYNGTYVNGERIAAAAFVGAGDTIKVGETLLTLDLPVAAPPPPPAPDADASLPEPPPPVPGPEAAGPDGVPDFMTLYGDGTMPGWWEPFRSGPFTIFAIVAAPLVVSFVLGTGT